MPNAFLMPKTSNSFGIPGRAILSAGQTRVDRAARDLPRELKIPHRGGWRRDSLAEDGRIDPAYSLQETTSTNDPLGTPCGSWTWK